VKETLAQQTQMVKAAASAFDLIVLYTTSLRSPWRSCGVRRILPCNHKHASPNT